VTSISWDPQAHEFLRKLPRTECSRIFRKIDNEVSQNVLRYLEPLAGRMGKKIRVGEYRLFVDYDGVKDRLMIRAIRHRKNAYKQQ